MAVSAAVILKAIDFGAFLYTSHLNREEEKQKLQAEIDAGRDDEDVSHYIDARMKAAGGEVKAKIDAARAEGR